MGKETRDIMAWPVYVTAVGILKCGICSANFPNRKYNFGGLMHVVADHIHERHNVDAMTVDVSRLVRMSR